MQVPINIENNRAFSGQIHFFVDKCPSREYN